MALGDEIELRVGELTPRGDAELAEYFPEVVVDGVGAEVELGGDLRVGRACGGQPGHLCFLWGEAVAVPGGLSGHGFPGCR